MAAWEAVAAATVAPAKAAALRCCTEKVKPKCFVCLVKCCGIAVTTSGGTTTLAQEVGTQMTPPPSPPPSDQDDDSISSLAFDDGGVDVYEAELPSGA